MPTFEVQDPDGLTLEIQGDSLPDKDSLSKMFGAAKVQTSAKVVSDTLGLINKVSEGVNIGLAGQRESARQSQKDYNDALEQQRISNEHQVAQEALSGIAEGIANRRSREASDNYYNTILHGTPEQRQALAQSEAVGTLSREGARSADELNQVYSALWKSSGESQVIPPPIPINPDDSIPMTVGKEVVNLATAIPRFITSPRGALLASAGIPFPRTTAAAFSADMLNSLGEQVIEAHKNWPAMTTAEKTSAVMNMAGTGLFVGLTAEGALRGVGKPEESKPLGQEFEKPSQEAMAALQKYEALKQVAPLTAEEVAKTDYENINKRAILETPSENTPEISPNIEVGGTQLAAIEQSQKPIQPATGIGETTHEIKPQPILPTQIRTGDRYFTHDYGYLTVEKVYPFDPKYPNSQLIETNRGRRDIGHLPTIMVERPTEVAKTTPDVGKTETVNAPDLTKTPGTMADEFGAVNGPKLNPEQISKLKEQSGQEFQIPSEPGTTATLKIKPDMIWLEIDSKVGKSLYHDVGIAYLKILPDGSTILNASRHGRPIDQIAANTLSDFLQKTSEKTAKTTTTESEVSNAVPIEDANEGVLREKRPEVGLPQVGEGNAQPEKAAEPKASAKTGEVKQPWEMTRAEYAATEPKSDGKREVLSAELGSNKVKVIKNPTENDYHQFNAEHDRLYPNDRTGDPKTRFTIDSNGNRYIWLSTDAAHSGIEHWLKNKLGVTANQNTQFLSHRYHVARALLQNKPVPEKVLQEYPDLKRNAETPSPTEEYYSRRRKILGSKEIESVLTDAQKEWSSLVKSKEDTSPFLESQKDTLRIAVMNRMEVDAATADKIVKDLIQKSPTVIDAISHRLPVSQVMLNRIGMTRPSQMLKWGYEKVGSKWVSKQSDLAKPKAQTTETVEPEIQWVRGESQRNSGGDLFFSKTSDVADNYGKVRPIKPEETPKNILTVTDKTELADTIGYKGDPLAEPTNTPKAKRFDVLAKKYAQENGYDAIHYLNGTFGEPELHVFKKEAKPETVEAKPKTEAKQPTPTIEGEIGKSEAKPPTKGIIAGTELEKWANDQLRGGATHLGPDVLAAYAIKGAAILERGIRDFAKWSAEMVKEHGPEVKPYLRRIYNQASQVFQSPGRYVVEGGKLKIVSEAEARKMEKSVKLSKDVSDIKKQLDLFDQEIGNALTEGGKFLPKELRPDVAKGAPAETGTVTSKHINQYFVNKLVTVRAAMKKLQAQLATGADTASIQYFDVLQKRFELAFRQIQELRRASHESLYFWNKIRGEYQDIARMAGEMPEIKARKPILDQLVKDMRDKNFARAGKGFVDYLRVNLFTPFSFTLDFTTNALVVASHIPAWATMDFAHLITGRPMTRTLTALRALRLSGKNLLPGERFRLPQQIEIGLGTTAGGEFQGLPKEVMVDFSEILRNSPELAAKLKNADYILGGPVRAKRAMDNFFGRFGATAELYNAAYQAGRKAKLKGDELKSYVEEFVNNPPDWAVESAIKVGGEFKFNRELPAWAERFSNNIITKLAVEAYPRWTLQFTKWAGEMIGADPSFARKIASGKVTMEEVAKYLAKAATGWGALVAFNQLFYNQVDPNTMEYVNEKGERVRLSGRQPFPELYFLSALFRGDIENAKAAFPYTSIPFASMTGGQGGLLSPIMQAMIKSWSGEYTAEQTARELTKILNNAIPGKSMLGLIRAMYDPTIREGIGAPIPGVAGFLPQQVNVTTGEPAAPQQRIPGTNIKLPTVGGTPFPGAVRVLNPIEKVLLNHGITTARPKRTSLIEIPASDVPKEIRREYEKRVGENVKEIIGEAIASKEWKDELSGKENFEVRRQLLVGWLNLARSMAKAEMAEKYNKGISAEKPQPLNVRRLPDFVKELPPPK